MSALIPYAYVVDRGFLKRDTQMVPVEDRIART